MSFNLSEESLQKIVQSVMSQLGKDTKPSCGCGCPTSSSTGPNVIVPKSSGDKGIFDNVPEAAQAAREAFVKLSEGGIAMRAKVIDIVKSMTVANAQEWGNYEFNETKIGRLEDKPGKLEIVKFVPGVEWIRPDAYSGDNGIMLEEFCPYGVIGAITPVTHSIPTTAGNVVNMVAAGNAIIFNPHPGGVKSAMLAISSYNAAIEKETGIKNLLCCIGNPTLESFDAICKSDLVNLMCITGGPAVVNAAMKSGKKSICAGPGNPPVIVDDTVDLNKAAADIIAGGGFDNNLLCVGEKEVFVLESVFDKFLQALEANGASKLSSNALDKLTSTVFDNKNGHYALKRDLVGKYPRDLANAIGASVDSNAKMLYAVTDANHPFVIEEQMMPMLPIVPVKNFEEAVIASKKAEHGYRHSAIVHSLDVSRMTMMARELDTTVFIKNGPCTAGLGLGGEGYLSYSIATTTGEGISNPKTFTRRRRCVMVGNLNIF